MLERRLIGQVNVAHYMLDPDALNLVVPGDLITSEEGFMNGHGTYRQGDSIYSSIMGTVEITNKLIMVNPLKSKYQPQVGDIVVGRVQEIASRRWKIDICAATVAFLSLNSTFIPEQRKKNEDDEFNMRRIMQEGDLIVAEVHSVNADKSYNLHTRNPKYGRLEPGVLVEVGHRQVKRQKHHMIALGRVGLILGNNGNLYLSNFKRNEVSNLKDIATPPNYLPEDYQAIAVIANILRVLATEGLEISEILVKELGELVAQKGLETASLLKEESELREELLTRVRERIPKRIEEISSSLRKN